MSRATFESLIESSSDPLFVVRRNGTIVWQNGASSHIFGGTAIGQQIDSLLGEGVRAFLATIHHYGTFQTTLPDEIRKGIQQTVVVANVSSGDLDSEHFAVFLYSGPAEKSSLHAKEEWLSTIAHDLKNPISAIFGYADTLLDTGLGASLSPQQREVLSRIRHTAARAADLVRNYQHISQLDLNRPIDSGAPLGLNVLLHDVINSTWREDPVYPKVMLDLDPELPDIAIDRISIERVFMNLFTNALKFSPKEKPIHLRSWHDDQRIHIAVTNYGPVIPEEKIAQIFEPYARLPEARSIPGTGLGLTIVRKIIERTGGAISVTSNAETGTTFTVSFPYQSCDHNHR